MREPKDQPASERKCNWCERGNDWSSEWEYVNSRRWYHQACINLMDMVS